MPRVSIVIYSLGAGGAERVAARLASHWAEKGWRINIIVFESGMNRPFYELHPSVEYHPLGIASGSINLLHAVVLNIRRIRVLRRSLKASNPDLIVSFMSETNVVTLVASAGLRRPVIVREANDPFHEPIGKIWKFLRRVTYPFADSVILLSEQSKNYFAASTRRLIQIIPNAVLPLASAANRSASRKSKTITAVGRLVDQKGFDMLLEAFSLITWDHPEWRLHIYGEGPLRAALQIRSEILGIAGRATLKGVTKDVSGAYLESDIFVMSSRFEGFPNSLCEAMASGLPIVSFDCPTGPSVIVRHGIDGLLVPPGDIWALAEAMEILISDADRCEAFGKSAKKISQRYSQQKIMNTWEQVVDNLVR